MDDEPSTMCGGMGAVTKVLNNQLRTFCSTSMRATKSSVNEGDGNKAKKRELLFE